MKDELLEVKEKYGDERKTEIRPSEEEFSAEDFYPDDPVVITVSHLGYIKRTPLIEFREQARGGVGSKGAATRDQDFTEYIHFARMHQMLLFFTQKGRCYWMKCYDIPEGAKNSKGRAIQNLLQIDSDDKVHAILPIRKNATPEFLNSHYVMFCTKNGTIKKTCLEAYSRPRADGVRAINILEGDRVVDVRLTNGNDEIVIANRSGRAVHFNESQVRAMGRVSTGVRGMRLTEPDDEVVGMIVINDKEHETVMVVSENGYGKRSDVDSYRITSRGTMGVKTLNITEKTGKVVALKSVTENEDLMIINKSGIVIRMAVTDARIMGRATQGVRLINLEKKGDTIASVCTVISSELEAMIEEENRKELEEKENALGVETVSQNAEEEIDIQIENEINEDDTETTI